MNFPLSFESVLAAYAAMLSTGLAVYEWRKSRRTVKLTAVPAMHPKPNMPGEWIRVSIQNHGFEPVHLERAGIGRQIKRKDLGWLGWRGLLKHKTWSRSWWYNATALPSSAICEPQLPAVVEPGRSILIWMPYDMLFLAQKEAERGNLRVWIQDALDRTFHSPILPVWWLSEGEEI